MNSEIMKSTVGNASREITLIAKEAEKYGWIVAAIPFLIYLTDKAYDFANDVMDKGYECGFKANSEGVEFRLGKQVAVE